MAAWDRAAMRTMYDSDTAADIPTTATAVAGYVDLWSPADWDRFPNATIKIRIARFVTQDGDALDVETTLATPQLAPGWTRRQHRLGRPKPWCYCNLATKDALFGAMQGDGLVLHQDWEWWSAGYFDYASDPPRLDPDAIATQYGHPPYTGGHYDLSLISDSYTGAQPTPQGDDDMAVLAQGDVEKAVYIVSNPPYGPGRHLTDNAQVVAYQAALVDPTIHTWPQYVIDRMKEVPDEATVLKAIAAIQPGGGAAPDHTHAVTATTTPPK